MRRKPLGVAMAGLALIFAPSPVVQGQALLEGTDLFVGGQDGIHTYRIPSLICTRKGTVLAFCEGRRDSNMDGTATDLVMKRSLGNDGTEIPSNASRLNAESRPGRRKMIWLPLQTLIPSTNGEAYMNPVPVIDRTDGTIYLLVNHYPQPYQDVPVHIWLMKSRDEGATWSSPMDITSGTGLKELGPGIGIQLKTGTLVVPTYDGVIFSNDHGASWKSGGKAPGPINESQVVELADGSLMLNMRGAPNRTVMKSEDGGETWGAPSKDAALTDPEQWGGCQASLIRLSRQDEGDSTNRLLFANPADLKSRMNLTVRLSYDEGNTWPVAKSIDNGPGGYSSMTVFPDGSVGIIYEGGSTNNGVVESNTKLAFVRFNLEWLTDGKDRLKKKE